nr:immunoglobulin heavy chain junction region [Macaca mulatta]MOW75176.1 immunoglobulin heavy chain junction region [Macaca mulatta]MOW75195.1 immunoglobulin heavy chain junction region [Macaca mulatta]MOW75214.1 immunoglobulin heavy chain junction region [Macaca mulatta]MOW75360.1 immunoglobulin heavy chain junction region [Macaca mulatta]
CARDHSGFDYW